MSHEGVSWAQDDDGRDTKVHLIQNWWWLGQYWVERVKCNGHEKLLWQTIAIRWQKDNTMNTMRFHASSTGHGHAHYTQWGFKSSWDLHTRDVWLIAHW